MGAKKHIKIAMIEKKISAKQIAEGLGKQTQSVYNLMYRDNMTFTEAERIADILDCDIIFRDRKSGAEY